MFYLGIDVAKAKIDCCLLKDPVNSKRKSKTFTNNKVGFSKLLEWIDKMNIPLANLHAIMEGTGVYHERAALALTNAGATVSIVNPAQVKDFGRGIAVRTKTDRMDSLVLARYGEMLQPPAWTPPPQEAKVLKALLARREAIAQDLRRELNRQEKAEVADTPELICQSLDDSIQFLQKQLDKIQKDIDDHINTHPNLRRDYELLISIPGVGQRVGNNLLSVIHSQKFDSAEQLAAYLGLVPVERQSGTSLLGKARLSKAGPPRIRAVLYMAAVVATRRNPHVNALYERLLAKNKSKMAAIGAAMRKLVHLCFGVLKNQLPYQANYANTACG
ncbi:IS110 family transposase [uncultured Vibrio sp.]|uniref:IS110 family transposase n=1 Tax=uncultured Vibrio sp. TaxID=114054 RepID=UPI002AA5E5FB|nr:IS110 family transposase [uncultured Vibrio sp.]